MISAKVVSIDAEICPKSRKVLDIGAVKGNGSEFRRNSLQEFSNFLRGAEFVCGHNVFNHDLNYLSKAIEDAGVTKIIDTLYLSPICFPRREYHSLPKDDKLCSDEVNNPLADAKKAMDLFNNEVAAFYDLDNDIKALYYGLLNSLKEYKHFFEYLGISQSNENIVSLIKRVFVDRICTNAKIEQMVEKYPKELAFALTQIRVTKYSYTIPPWVLKNYPRTLNILHFLRGKKCVNCDYCNKFLDANYALKKYFGFDEYRSYDGEPLQKKAADAAIMDKSLLAVFPTGGGKSITFQIPALMAGDNEKGLTIVISPLQSLMKDQVDNLELKQNITGATTINGSLSVIERQEAFKAVESGVASILYISPESLRSKSIETLILKRNIVRFVIDEAHCFSSWGQDFRVDYLYIADFIKKIQDIKEMPEGLGIPVSCFTATAKKRVIEDIRKYFKDNLNLDLELFTASVARPNLNYEFFQIESKEDKFEKLCMLIDSSTTPVIVYCSRTKRTEEIAAKLIERGYSATFYHGKIKDRAERIKRQESFMRDEVKIIVATTAFGMGVDKSDVGMVVHYDISDSLENYVQEAGRAGRDPKIKADCFVLFNDEDINKHFIMLNQTKISQKEIGQVWRALKDKTHNMQHISKSPLEIARDAGWDDTVDDMETRIKTAISALEQASFVKRGQNMPRIYADSLIVKSMAEAREIIDKSPKFDDKSRLDAIRIISSLIGAKSRAAGSDEGGESRIDYISDILGIETKNVIRTIGLLRDEKILAKTRDLVAFITKDDKENKSKKTLALYKNVELELCKIIKDFEETYSLKEINETLHALFSEISISHIQTILNYYEIKRIIKRHKEINKNFVTLKPYSPMAELLQKIKKRHRVSEFIIKYLYKNATLMQEGSSTLVAQFSVQELRDEYILDNQMFSEKCDSDEIEDALYYLLKIGSIKVEGGFLVMYSTMKIERIEKDNKARYTKEHYTQLEEYYKHKRQQIHIVGEFAKKMLESKAAALDFVNDYFAMDYEMFLHKYFRGRIAEIDRNITPKKYKQLFGELSKSQLEIINDDKSKYIVVGAGPGSGKTKLLVHKLASLFIMEDVKREQMLMLTFSRASATEFKLRLIPLIGGAAHFVQISTFHSYCFDLLGKVGTVEKSDEIIKQTVERIQNGDIEPSKITKTVLVIDEAQDMSECEFSLVKALMDKNDELRVIAVGDDDQNIYEFRGSDSKHLYSLINDYKAKQYELIDNFRSYTSVVNFANEFARRIKKRLKMTPIKAVQDKQGVISIRKLKCKSIVIPTAEAFLATRPNGKTCIITRTNEEAQNIAYLLAQEGLRVAQIRGGNNDSFKIYNFAEVRDFIEYTDIHDGYTASDELWQGAKLKLSKKYEHSTVLKGVIKLIRDFEQLNTKAKYKSDFKQFMRESRLEDMVEDSDSEIFVSTIHQSKGREFDNIFLALSSFGQIDDAKNREIYVAITRAKQNLWILTNTNYFDNINLPNIQKIVDDKDYGYLNKISIQLTLSCVNLGSFKKRRQTIDGLYSSGELQLSQDGCKFDGTQILMYSLKFKEKLAELSKKGYKPIRANIGFITFWYDKDKDEEIKTVLPILEFSKEGDTR